MYMRRNFLCQGASHVEVAGSFNNWTKVPMTRGPWEWSLSFNLAPGEHKYKFIEDNEWRLDQEKPTKNDDMGNLNNIVTEVEKDDKGINTHLIDPMFK